MRRSRRFSDRMYRDGILDLFKKLKDKIDEKKAIIASLPRGKKALYYLMNTIKLIGSYFAGLGTINAVFIAKQIRDNWKLAKSILEAASNLTEADYVLGTKLNTSVPSFLRGLTSPYEYDEKTGHYKKGFVHNEFPDKTKFTIKERIASVTPLSFAKTILGNSGSKPIVIKTIISIIGGLISAITATMIESKIVNNQKKKLGIA